MIAAAVRRAETPAGLDLLLAAMLANSPLLLAQPFSPTDFDWRIGVLEGRLLYACKYHMARGHWQIAQYDGKGGSRSGRVEGVAIAKVPVRVREIALESSALAAKVAQDMGLTPVCHVEGGFGAWKKAGAPVETVEPKHK